MNDQRDRRFVQQSIDKGLSSMQGDPWLAQRIMASEKGEGQVKRKISWAVVMVTAAILAIATAALAEMADINVFELFRKTDERYASLAPYAVLDEVSEVSVASVEIGETRAAINSAYYDGQSLIVGYFIENASRMEEFVPDEALMGKMTPGETNAIWAADNGAEAVWIAKLEQARAEGTAMGLASYVVYPSDHTVTEEGIDIAPRSEEAKTGDDGIEYTIREYEFPLDEELQNLEGLTIGIPLYQSANYLYFDGKTLYTYQEVHELSPMKAVVWNAHVSTSVFRGSGEYNGIKLNAEARVSAANATLEIRLEEALSPVPDLDHWYVFRLTDENGKALREDTSSNGGDKEIIISYEGTGMLPQELQLVIYMENEGEFDLEEALRAAEPIILTAQQ